MKPLALGLDISDYSIELVALQEKRGAAVVSRAARAELPPGLIRRGVIQDPDRLTGELTRLLDGAFGLKRPKLAAALALPETQVFSKVFAMPDTLTPAQAAQAAAIGAADSLPVAVEDAVANTVAGPVAPKGQQTVFYAAAPKRVVALYVELMRRAGLKPMFFDGESLSIARALIDPADGEPVLIADIGAKTSLLTVIVRGRVAFSSSVNVAGDALTSAIELKLNLPLDKAEKLKRKAGFDPSAEGGRVFLILQKPMSEIIDEMSRTLRYYEKAVGRPIKKILLAGGTSLIPGVVDYVASNFSGATVARGEPLKALSIDPEAKIGDLKKNSILYATAAGLALRAAGLRDGPGLNLMPGNEARGHGATASVGKALNAVSEIISMVTRTRKTHPRKKAAPHVEPAETAAEAPVQAPVPSYAAPPEAEPAPAAKAPEAEPQPAETDGPDYGGNIGEILDAVAPVDRDAAAETESPPEPEAGHDEEPGHKHLSIESIISRAKQSEPPAPAAVMTAKKPRSARPSVGKLLILVIILLLAAAVGIFLFIRKNGPVSAGLWSRFAAKPAAPAQPVAAPKPTAGVQESVSVVAKVGTNAPQPGGTEPFITGRIVETDVVAQDTFKATGTAQTAGGKASGIITIINTTPKSYTFVATTRFLTKDGVLFRLKSAANIPASGQVDAAVAADQPGAQGDIGPSDFTIPGLSADLQAKIYGKSQAAMTGGAGTAKAVSQADLDQAKASLMNKLNSESQGNLKAMAAPGEVLLPDLITSKELTSTAPKAGTAVSSFTMKLSVRFRAMLLPSKDALDLLQAKMVASLPASQLPNYELGEPQYTVQAYPADGLAEVRIDAPLNKH